MNFLSPTELFLRYTQISSQSESSSHDIPSSSGQIKLANLLAENLKSWNINDIELTENGILIAKIPGNLSIPSIALIAHLDTVDIGMNPNIKAQIINFSGNNFPLDEKGDIIFDVKKYPEILAYKNEKIIVSDGSSVLGADDKAGIAVIMALAQHLKDEKLYGPVYLVFLPDEEIGLKGAYSLDIKKIPVDFAYTIDGGPIGEFGYQTFNAAEATITIEGVAVHPGCAKGILVNAILVAHDFINFFDRFDTPEHSENQKGFFFIDKFSGDFSKSTISLIIRDFDKNRFMERKNFLTSIITKIQKLHPEAKIHYTIQNSYENIANHLSENDIRIELVKNAMQNLNIPIKICPIRGGTDGSVISTKGIPTANIFTGGHLAHSIFEYLPISSLNSAFETVLEIIKILSDKKNSKREK